MLFELGPVLRTHDHVHLSMPGLAGWLRSFLLGGVLLAVTVDTLQGEGVTAVHIVAVYERVIRKAETFQKFLIVLTELLGLQHLFFSRQIGPFLRLGMNGYNRNEKHRK